MAAPKTMAKSSKPSGLRKLFSRKGKSNSHNNAAQQLKVASPPPNSRSFPNSTSDSISKQMSETNAANNNNNSSSTKSTKKRGFWARKEDRVVRTPSVPVDPSSESSEDVAIIASKYDLEIEERQKQEQKDKQLLTQSDIQEHIRSIRPIDDDHHHRAPSPPATRKSRPPAVVENISPVREGPRYTHTSSHRTSSSGRVVNGKNIISDSTRSLQSESIHSIAQQKQHNKERDGFCRRVDKYDGSVITVEGQAAYELGNYLGGGVAGVVYEGHRLLPVTEYPVRTGAVELPKPLVINVSPKDGGGAVAPTNNFDTRVNSLLSSCVPANSCLDQTQVFQDDDPPSVDVAANVSRSHLDNMMRDDGSFLTMDSYHSRTAGGGGGGGSLAEEPPPDTVALEAVDNMVLIDAQDAPNRSNHMAQAVVTDHNTKNHDFPSDASFTGAGFMEETVAIKILNPVGFRTLASEVTHTAVIAREGAPFPTQKAPMEEKHVWWLINPQSRNLRTLQRYTIDTPTPRGVEVDRGNPERGLRISLIAAYKDPTDGKIKELPLTRCIEIWGHVPFEASDEEFREVMTAIDKINQGLPPPAIAAFDEAAPGRVATSTSSDVDGGSDEPQQMSSLLSSHDKLGKPTQLTSKRT